MTHPLFAGISRGYQTPSSWTLKKVSLFGGIGRGAGDGSPLPGCGVFPTFFFFLLPPEAAKKTFEKLYPLDLDCFLNACNMLQ